MLNNSGVILEDFDSKLFESTASLTNSSSNTNPAALSQREEIRRLNERVGALEEETRKLRATVHLLMRTQRQQAQDEDEEGDSEDEVEEDEEERNEEDGGERGRDVRRRGNRDEQEDEEEDEEDEEDEEEDEEEEEESSFKRPRLSVAQRDVSRTPRSGAGAGKKVPSPSSSSLWNNGWDAEENGSSSMTTTTTTFEESFGRMVEDDEEEVSGESSDEEEGGESGAGGSGYLSKHSEHLFQLSRKQYETMLEEDPSDKRTITRLAKCYESRANELRDSGNVQEAEELEGKAKELMSRIDTL